ncbi:hypothetical protein LguiB_030073 [Lonicera macranthoides]
MKASTMAGAEDSANVASALGLVNFNPIDRAMNDHLSRLANCTNQQSTRIYTFRYPFSASNKRCRESQHSIEKMELSLRISEFSEDSHVSKWICAALERCHRDVALDFRLFGFESVERPLEHWPAVCFPNLNALDLKFKDNFEYNQMGYSCGCRHRLDLVQELSINVPTSYEIEVLLNPAARELELNLPVFLNHLTELPRSLFACKTLEVLNLSEGITFNIPKEGSILHLIRVKYVKNGDCLGKLMRNCPVLEDLVIRKTSGGYLSDIELRAHAVRSLELNFSIEAKVGVRHRSNVVFEEGKNVYKLLKASNKVKCLSVLGDTARVIKNRLGYVPLFWNLTRLEMVLSCCDFACAATISSKVLQTSATGL